MMYLRKNWRTLSKSGLLVLLIISLPQAIPAVSSWKCHTQKKFLDNGLAVIIDRDVSSEITVLKLFITGGKKAEPVGKEGLAYLTTRLAVEIPDQGKIQELMRQSSRFYVTSRGDYSLISLECLTSNLESMLKTVSKIMLKPLFSGLRIDAVKKSMAHHEKVQQDDSIYVGHLVQMGAFFGKSGYGSSIYGDEESLKSIKGRDVTAFYETYFRAPNMFLTASSDMEETVLLDIIARYFQEFPGGKPEDIPAVTFFTPEEREFSLTRDTEQCFISFAFPLPKMSEKSFVLATMLENLLGKGPGSQLWFLRSENRLAYNINSRATQLQDGGTLEAYLETDDDKRDSALEAARQVLDDLYSGGISEEEFLAAKECTKANFLRTNETKEIRTLTMGAFEALGLGHEFLSKFFDVMESVTLEEMNSFVKEILLPDKRVEVVVGRQEAGNQAKHSEK